MRQPTVDCSHLTDVRRLTVNTCSQFNARPELCERSRVGTTPCKLTQSGTNATPTCHRDLQSKPCAHAGSLVASISRLFSTEARPHASLSLHTFFIETSSAWRTAEYCTTLRLNLAHDHVAKVSLVTTVTEEEVHRRCAWFFGLVPQQHAPPPPPPPPPRPPPPPPPPPPPIIPFAYGTGSGRPSRRARRARRRAAAAKPEPPQTPLTAEQLGRLFVRRVGSLKSLTYATLLRHASDAIIGAPLLPRSSRAPAPVPEPLTQVVVHADVAVGEWGGMPASCACLLRARRVAFLIRCVHPTSCIPTSCIPTSCIPTSCSLQAASYKLHPTVYPRHVSCRSLPRLPSFAAARSPSAASRPTQVARGRRDARGRCSRATTSPAASVSRVSLLP